LFECWPLQSRVKYPSVSVAALWTTLLRLGVMGAITRNIKKSVPRDFCNSFDSYIFSLLERQGGRDVRYYKV